MIDMVSAYKAMEGLIPQMKGMVHRCHHCELDTGKCPYMEEDQEEQLCHYPRIIEDAMETMMYQEDLLRKATGVTWEDGRPLLPHEEDPAQGQKYNSISDEILENVLTKAGVLKERKAAWENDCKRIFVCEALGNPFEIEWWINLCYLRINGTIIPFHWVHETDTWPGDGIRRELKFQNAPDRWMHPGDIVAILPLEYRKEE